MELFKELFALRYHRRVILIAERGNMKFCKIELKAIPSNCGECKYISARPEYDDCKNNVVKGISGITGEEFLMDYSSRMERCPYNYSPFCKKCGEIFLHQNYLYCPHCGKKLAERGQHGLLEQEESKRP